MGRDEVRDFVFIDDVVAALLAACDGRILPRPPTRLCDVGLGA